MPRQRLYRCIGGYAGCKNMGDDAILEGMLLGASVEERSRIILFSGSPRRDARRFGVRCVHRRNPFAIALALLRSHTFLCGGGSLLQNATGTLSLVYYLALLRLADRLGCEVRLLSAGIGPLHGERARRWVASTLSVCDRIEVRDRDSLLLLSSLGIPTGRIMLTSDPAFRLDLPPKTRLAYLKQEAGLGEGEGYFCVVVREAERGAQDLTESLIAAIRIVARKSGRTPIYLIFDEKNDREITERAARLTGGRIPRLREARDALAWLDGGDFLIGMRLHALIFAIIAETRAIGVSPSESEPKLRALCRERGIPHFSPKTLTIPTLVDKIERL